MGRSMGVFWHHTFWSAWAGSGSGRPLLMAVLCKTQHAFHRAVPPPYQDTPGLQLIVLNNGTGAFMRNVCSLEIRLCLAVQPRHWPCYIHPSIFYTRLIRQSGRRGGGPVIGREARYTPWTSHQSITGRLVIYRVNLTFN